MAVELGGGCTVSRGAYPIAPGGDPVNLGGVPPGLAVPVVAKLVVLDAQVDVWELLVHFANDFRGRLPGIWEACTASGSNGRLRWCWQHPLDPPKGGFLPTTYYLLPTTYYLQWGRLWGRLWGRP